MIKEQCVENIKKTATIDKIVGDLLDLKPKGNSLIGDCPFCQTKKKFNVNTKKEIWKCFGCDEGGKGAISFVMKHKSLNYPDALRFCADMCNITIEEDTKSQQIVPSRSDSAFRNAQLLASGIKDEYQRSVLKNGMTINRYQAGSLDKNGNYVNGDDMVLNYVNLEGMRITYTNPFSHQIMPLLRVRFQYPEQHTDKKGKPVKYKQPYKSGSHLWIPELIRKCFIEAKEFDTLVITEGEKKADKLCMHGIFAIAIMGIHNLTFSESMSEQFVQIIKRCKVKNVVFLLDADWQDLSNSTEKSVDSRPNTFFRAVQKFRDYFFHYNRQDINLEIFFSYIKANDAGDKGADDLLCNTLKGSESKLEKDLEQSMTHREGKGEYLDCHKITTVNDYKLKGYWHLNSPDEFFKLYHDELVKRKQFKFGKKTWTFDGVDSFVIVNMLLPNEQFWIVEEKKDREGNLRKRYLFDYQNIRVFLRNRGFGRLQLNKGVYRFVRVVNNIVEETDPVSLGNFTTDFAEEIGEIEVLRMLLRGSTQYLGPDKLAKLYELTPSFLPDFKDFQYLFFKNTAWRISGDSIVECLVKNLPGAVWDNQIIDFESQKTNEPLVSVKRVKGKFTFEESPEAKSCQIIEFLKRTSNFNWEDDYQLTANNRGAKTWMLKPGVKESKGLTEHATQHFICKMLALGYCLHNYQNKSEAKAIVCMDGKESEVGASEGGTGKSLFGMIVAALTPTVIVDGKKQKLTEDQFIYEEADERTKVIFFDDCRTNLDFEHFFGQITRGITVNEKGVKRYSLPAPKFLFTTNHAINGDGNSFKRRQYLLSFSDWYNEHRTPKDDFGCILFDEWDDDQWNLFYNFAACCIQTYLKFGLSLTIPADDLERRQLRQYIGDDFLDWATSFYDKSNHINKKVPKELAYENFVTSFPNERRYCNIRKFKVKLKKYCAYKRFEFNPIAPEGSGKDIKSNGREFFIVADTEFNPNSFFVLEVLS